MQHFDRFIIGAAAVVIGILGLFLASRAVDGVFDAVGLLLFIFSVLFVFGLIGRDEPADQ